MLKEKMKAFTDAELALLREIKRGVEKENLRVNHKGELSIKPHPSSLGDPLTNPKITLDFSEAQIEMITPPMSNVMQTYQALQSLHQFIADHLGDEYLWPNSMPCYLPDASCVPLANFGNTPEAKRMHVYRRGLCHRYGRAMQVISGIHYNFSLPSSFLLLWQERFYPKQTLQETANQLYFGMARNFFRYAWVLPYLFGASPICAESSVTQSLPYLKSWEPSSVYAPHATSLRLSDLGYYNKGLSLINVSYNSVEAYARGLIEATETRFPEFEAIGLGEPGHERQLSDRLLQIENEYYSPIRPKPGIPKSNKPSHALLESGVAYLEVRALDLNPLLPINVEVETFAFLDLFLLSCLLRESAPLGAEEFKLARENLKQTAIQGRNPDMMINLHGASMSFQAALNQFFDELQPLVEKMEGILPEGHYLPAFQKQLAKVNEVSLTPSAMILQEMKEMRCSFQDYNLAKIRRFNMS